MRGLHGTPHEGRGTAMGARGRRPGRGTIGALIVVAGLLPVVLAACGLGSGNGATRAADQTFVWPYYATNAADPSHPTISHDEILDPATTQYLVDIGTVSMLYTNLVTLSSGLRVIPDAITSMPEVDSTGTIYTFHLRPNLKFNDGAALTAADFAYGIDRSLDPNLCKKLDANTYGSGPRGNGLCQPIATSYLIHILGAPAREAGTISSLIGTGNDPNKGLNVLDPQTLRIRLDAPVAFFLEALTYPTSAPLERSLVEKPAYGGGLWVDHLDQGSTSGPFQVQSYGQGKQLTLVPNQYWEAAWGKTLTLRKVIRPAVGSLEEEYQAYRQGNNDYTDVPADQYSRARGQGDFNEVPSLQTDYFGLNFRLPPFNNLQVRQAFDLALNKQYLVDSIENGGAIPTNHVIPQGMPGFSPGLKNPAPDSTQSITGNQAAAQQLLQQAQATCGGPSGDSGAAHDYCAYITGPNPLPITVVCNQGNATRVSIIKQAAAAWNAALAYKLNGKTVPLNVQAQPLDGGTMGQNLYSFDKNDPTLSTNPYQMWTIGWVADYPDPQDWTSLQFVTGAPNNVGSWSSASLDALLKQADREQDVGKRMSEYNQAEQLIVNSGAWIPYQQSKTAWRVRPKVRGFGLNQIEAMVDINWPNVGIYTLSS
ncbi:MAG: hypothetical protein IVW57_07430 [Ktedonobacterales bacterium]|nr:hypothetical protein [Ktedonobacterales bacterium]